MFSWDGARLVLLQTFMAGSQLRSSFSVAFRRCVSVSSSGRTDVTVNCNLARENQSYFCVEACCLPSIGDLRASSGQTAGLDCNFTGRSGWDFDSSADYIERYRGLRFFYICGSLLARRTSSKFFKGHDETRSNSSTRLRRRRFENSG